MANTITITKLQNGNVEINNSLRNSLGKSLPPDLFVDSKGDGDTIYLFRSVNELAYTLRASEVEEVVRQDGTIVPITTELQLYTELKDNFFF